MAFNIQGPGWFLLLDKAEAGSEISPTSITSEEAFGSVITENCCYVPGYKVKQALVPAITMVNQCLYPGFDIDRKRRKTQRGFLVCNKARCS